MKTDYKGYRIYHPSPSGKGAALQFNIHGTLDTIWMEIAPQNGDKSFDWSRKIVMKLGENDILSLIYALSVIRTFDFQLAVATKDFTHLKQLTKDGEFLNLFHKSPKGTAAISLRLNDPKYPPFLMRVSKKTADFEATYQTSISAVEATGLLVCLEKVANALVERSREDEKEDGDE